MKFHILFRQGNGTDMTQEKFIVIVYPDMSRMELGKSVPVSVNRVHIKSLGVNCHQNLLVDACVA